MAVGKDSRLIQVKISLKAYDYLKKYSELFGISISRFCEIAINDAIIKRGKIE